MSYLVLHMDKFKKEAIRGIQSHNRRQRESHSNPDIDYDRSSANYELHESASTNYAEAIQRRIDALQLAKAVRKDAVRMCGLIVTSDSAFFQSLSPEDTRRFFEESKAFLTEFVGAENVVSAMVHMDEKTPHMHFLHVPVTPDGRLNANKIYTRQSLRKLQSGLPAHLQSRGFVIERGVEQTPGSVKKHMDTREFKQQQEALEKLIQESEETSRNSRQLISALEQRKEELRACLETSAFIVTRRHVDKKRLCAAAKTREDCQTVPQRSDGQRMGACTSSPAPCFWRRSEAQNRPA